MVSTVSTRRSYQRWLDHRDGDSGGIEILRQIPTTTSKDSIPHGSRRLAAARHATGITWKHKEVKEARKQTQRKHAESRQNSR